MISLFLLFFFFSCLFSFLFYFYDTHPASRSIMIITSFLPMTIILMIIQLSPESSVYKNHVRVQRCFLQRGSASYSKWHRRCCFCKTSCSHQNAQFSLDACRLRVGLYNLFHRQRISSSRNVYAFWIDCAVRYEARFRCDCCGSWCS